MIVKTMFALTIFKILLFKYSLVLGTAEQVPGNERVMNETTT